MRGGSNQKASDDDTGQVGGLASALSRTASRMHVTRTRSMTNLLFSKKSSIFSVRRTIKGRMPVDTLGITPDTDGSAGFAPPPSTSALWDLSEERNSRDLGTIDAILARHNMHPSLSAYSADSLSTNRTTCSSGTKLWTEPSSTETDPELDEDSKDLDHDTSSDCDTREALIVPSSNNTSGPEVLQKSETEHLTEDQMSDAKAPGNVPANDSPCLDQQPNQRKTLSETNKAVETQQEPFQLSEEGKKFSKELELRFALSGCVEIPSGTIPRPSPASSLTTSLKKSNALDLLCYASYGKEQAMESHHRSIREAFQNVVAGSRSLRWLRSRGRGMRFSRKPIPDF
ncbi:hypothetical protein SPBR_08991 [Sporothrix brasiliensis 5110]|uniref:Uncharacterized protein n=1 Tax=Sporothrix brasiliensis 5110 TaxID=1398154 RepID=A0A0C2IHF5_9PEZI|nr:uncharacterized protein SPBR_08991 [Sporothrix brasiliensis 5110]KIH88616.1 hypothetical protein SPBR_08991 [Sporothrix brasiliensis 5110]